MYITLLLWNFLRKMANGICNMVVIIINKMVCFNLMLLCYFML